MKIRTFSSLIVTLGLGALLIGCTAATVQSGWVQPSASPGTSGIGLIATPAATLASILATPSPRPVPSATPTPKPTPVIVQLTVVSCAVQSMGLVQSSGGKRIAKARVSTALLGGANPASLALFAETPYPGQPLSLADAILAPVGWSCTVFVNPDSVNTVVSPPKSAGDTGIAVSGANGGFDDLDIVDACQHNPTFRTAFLKTADPMYADGRAQCQEAHPDGLRIRSDHGFVYSYDVTSGGATTYWAFSWEMVGSSTHYSCGAPATEALCKASRALFFTPSSVH